MTKRKGESEEDWIIRRNKSAKEKYHRDKNDPVKRARINANNRRWGEKNKKYFQLMHLRKKFGLNEEEYLEYFKKQNNKCAMCKVKNIHPFTQHTHVDHKHIEGYKDLPQEEKKKYIRGVLCQQCNLGLGQYERYHILAREFLNTYGIEGACY